MKRLLLALTALATPATATPTFILQGWTANSGSPINWTIKRTGTDESEAVVTFQTSDSALAKAGTDYEGTTLVINFTSGRNSVTIPTETYTNLGLLGKSIPVYGQISVLGRIVATAGSVIVEPVQTAQNTPTPAPTQTCPDGSIILTTSTCPAADTTGSGSGDSVDNPTTGQSAGVGAPDIATTDHNVLDDLLPSWDCTNGVCGGIPPKNTPDVVGAFRFICGHNDLKYDDPTVYYQQPGKSHLHDQTGVEGWDAYSNYYLLRTGGGGSQCNNVSGQDHDLTKVTHAANRTPYWQPALLDGKGNVILVDYTSFYYKRRPLSDPIVSNPSNPQYMGKGVPLPNGIKFIFGGFPSNSSATPVPAIYYGCTNGTKGAVYPSDGTFAGAVACAKAHSDGTLVVRMSAPDCWDGVNLDSPDHRSHLAYGSYGNWGYLKCDAQHPYVIPTFTYAAFYTILPTDTGDIHWSSDEMDNTKPRGWSFHVDYGPAAWDPVVKGMWENGCIDSFLNCSGGDLGNGKQLKGAAVPIYYSNGVWTSLWRNPNRLVPVPPHP